MIVLDGEKIVEDSHPEDLFRNDSRLSSGVGTTREARRKCHEGFREGSIKACRVSVASDAFSSPPRNNDWYSLLPEYLIS